MGNLGSCSGMLCARTDNDVKPVYSISTLYLCRICTPSKIVFPVDSDLYVQYKNNSLIGFGYLDLSNAEEP